MAAHNYIASPTFPDPVVKQAPVRTALTVDYSESDTVELVDDHWSRKPILGGDPPIIVGWRCGQDWYTTFEYKTVHLTCDPQALTIPATVDGQAVRAVALYLVIDNTWVRAAAGGGQAVERGEGLDDCGLILSQFHPDAGPQHLEVFVDDTQVVSFDGAAPPSGASTFTMDFFATLPLPGIVRTPSAPPTGPAVIVNGAPFHPVTGQTEPFSWLFWGTDEPGESLPDEISFEYTMENVRFQQVRHPVESDPGPYPGLNPATVYSSTNAYVDVYPYIVLPEQDQNLMMVV